MCDLVDDCGDASDEEECDNSFQCLSGDYLPLHNHCDRVIHCPDLSDECNDNCGKQIIRNVGLKVMALIIT